MQNETSTENVESLLTQIKGFFTKELPTIFRNMNTIKLSGFRSLFLWLCGLSLGILCSCNNGSSNDLNRSPVGLKEEMKSYEIHDTVVIGKQIWMRKNLAVDKFQNGESIREAKSSNEWDNAASEKTAAWAYYDFDPTNGEKYGKLYNWYAVNDPRGLAPKGWHIPSDQEWTELTDFLGGKEIAGKKMKSNEGWMGNENGSNESGFDALPGGFLTVGFAKFIFMNGGFGASFWTSTESSDDAALDRNLYGTKDHVHKSIYGESMLVGKSVRCIKN